MWNKLKRPLQAVLLLAVVGLCIWAILPIQQKIHLGLDLQGGIHLVLKVKTDDALRVETETSADQFVEALKTNLTGGWLLRFLARNPRVLAEAAGIL